MAKYLIFDNSSDTVHVKAIAESEAEKNSFKWLNEDCRVIETTDENFQKVKLNLAQATCDTNNNINFIEHTNPWMDKDGLDDWLKIKKERIKEFLNRNPNHPFYSEWNNYHNYLNNLDTSTISYNITTWEDYCNSNSIPFKNILQLP
jgi:hypothetical protein